MLCIEDRGSQRNQEDYGILTACYYKDKATRHFKAYATVMLRRSIWTGIKMLMANLFGSCLPSPVHQLQIVVQASSAGNEPCCTEAKCTGTIPVNGQRSRADRKHSSTFAIVGSESRPMTCVICDWRTVARLAALITEGSLRPDDGQSG